MRRPAYLRNASRYPSTLRRQRAHRPSHPPETQVAPDEVSAEKENAGSAAPGEQKDSHSAGQD